MDTLNNQRISQSQLDTILRLIRKAKHRSRSSYERRRSGQGSHTLTAWNGRDEVGTMSRCESQLPDQRWTWVVAAPMAEDFRSHVLTSGSTRTSHEAAVLIEAGYERLMWLHQYSNASMADQAQRSPAEQSE